MNKELKQLHLGCGTNSVDGWLNVDGSWQVVLARHRWLKKALVLCRIMPKQQAEIPWGNNVVRLNLRKALPFSDGQFQAIYSSHTLEHLYFTEAQNLLKECYRVLRPGGVCRFVVPDLESVVRWYIDAKKQGKHNAADEMMSRLYVHEQSVRKGLLAQYHRITSFHQHKWMYDSESLQESFRAAGFHEVRNAADLVSKIAGIDRIEDSGRVLNGEGVVVEGTKS